MTPNDTPELPQNAPLDPAPPANVTAPTEVEKDDFKELVKAMLFAAVIALTIRSFLFEPFNIPSGSMFPTLLVGDYLFVEKYAYGYSKYSFPLDMPAFDGRILERQVTRGDVVVFRKPTDVSINYIKRIIGLPGDKLQMREGRLYINDRLVMRDFVGTDEVNDDGHFELYKKYIETLPNGLRHYIYEIGDDQPLDNTPLYTVPAGHYFAMGDNRDGSQDSRVMSEVGFVPAENVVGRAEILFFSTDGIGEKCDRDGTLAALKSLGCKLKAWPKAIRYSRMFKIVNNI